MDQRTSEAFGTTYFEEVYPTAQLRPLSMNWWSARFYAGLCRRILRARGGQSLLELGCGFGHTLALLPEFTCVGIDVAPEDILDVTRENTPRATILRGDIAGATPEAVRERRFDMVLAKYVFEHTLRPEEAIRTACQFLNPGGTLLYAVPNCDHPLRTWKGEAWYALQDPTHVNLLWPEEWLLLTEAAGFRIQAVHADGFWDVPYVGGIPPLAQMAVGMALGGVQVLTKRLFLPRTWGENIIVVAQRGE